MHQKSKIVLCLGVLWVSLFTFSCWCQEILGFFTFSLDFRIEIAWQIWLFVAYFISLFNLLSFVNCNIINMAILWKKSYEILAYQTISSFHEIHDLFIPKTITKNFLCCFHINFASIIVTFYTSWLHLLLLIIAVVTSINCFNTF